MTDYYNCLIVFKTLLHRTATFKMLYELSCYAAHYIRIKGVSISFVLFFASVLHITNLVPDNSRHHAQPYSIIVYYVIE